MSKNNWIKYTLAIANSIIPITSLYFFCILNTHKPSGDESVVILFYVVGLLVVALDLFFVFKKSADESKKFNPLNVIILFLVFNHLAINLGMFVLVMALMQL